MKKIFAGGDSIHTISLPIKWPLLKSCVTGDDRPKLVLYQTDLEPDIREMDGFRCVWKYGRDLNLPECETGMCGQFRFITCSDIHIGPDRGANWAPELYSTSKNKADVYETLVIDEARLFKVFQREALDLMRDDRSIFKMIKEGEIADAAIYSGVTDVVMLEKAA